MKNYLLNFSPFGDDLDGRRTLLGILLKAILVDYPVKDVKFVNLSSKESILDNLTGDGITEEQIRKRNVELCGFYLRKPRPIFLPYFEKHLDAKFSGTMIVLLKE